MNIKKKNFKHYSLLLAFTFILQINFCNRIKVYATPNEIDKTKIILIDPGHGGIDGGAVSRKGFIEKDINLAICLKIRDRLKQLGYQVLLTREEDKGLYISKRDINMMKREDLSNRCKMKKDSDCDLFISLHQNFFRDTSCKGAQVWYTRNEDSKRLAHILQQNLANDLGDNSRQEKEAKNDYKVLRCFTDIPSVIVECGFLTNPVEEKLLVSSKYQDKIADSIVKSLKEYFDTSNK